MQSIKKYLIANASSLASLGYQEGATLNLITASGIISGLPLTNEDDFFFGYVREVVKNYKDDNNLPTDYIPEGNDGFILLKDATVRSGDLTFTTGSIAVFFDQIIGVTVGEIT